MAVNLWGVIHAVKAFVPRMIEGGDEGHVVVTSSMAGLACAAFSGPYQTSKFGAYAVAESLARLPGLLRQHRVRSGRRRVLPL